MLLRRIIEHVTAQNWFAVVLDFFIVVLGVGAALAAEQWLDDRCEAANLDRVELALRDELFDVYLNAKERIAVTECRKQRIQILADLLAQPDEDWPGAPLFEGISSENLTFPEVLHSPNRGWESALWDAELAQGNLASMEIERRNLYLRAFEDAKYMETLQERIIQGQTRLKLLALKIKLTPSDRLRYLDSLAKVDTDSANLELSSEQIISWIESIGSYYNRDERETRREIVATQNASASDVYGDCREPVVIPFLAEES